MTICRECKSDANFNIEGQKALYCVIHKKSEMVDVRSQKCIHENCKTRANYNIEGQKALYCVIHKTHDMVDVRSQKCIHDGCKSQPNYNTEGQKALYCVIHKTHDMVDVRSQKCIHENCKSHRTYNIEGQKALYCGIHKRDDMVGVTNQRCKTHLCNTRASNKQYRGHCLRCFMHTFPNEPVSRNYKTKEQAVVENIKEEFPDIDWIEDMRIDGGCSLRRPDLKADMGSHIILMEIDENKHDSYDCSCDNKRTMELSRDVGHRPIVFVRFNPDSYTDDNGVKITSCWGVNKQGIMIIKKCKIKEWKNRITSLNLQIQYWIDNIPDKTIETIQLYY